MQATLTTRLRAGLVLVLLLALTGCATLEDRADKVREFAGRHPVATAIGTAVVVGGVVAALDADHGSNPRIVIPRHGP